MLEISVPSTNLVQKLTGLNPALLPRCFMCLDLPGNSSELKNQVYTGRKLRRVVPGISVPSINLGKKLTGLIPALLPRYLLCLDLLGTIPAQSPRQFPAATVSPGFTQVEPGWALLHIHQTNPDLTINYKLFSTNLEYFQGFSVFK